MSNTTSSNHIQCDLLVIGSGAGGLSTAITAKKYGLKSIGDIKKIPGLSLCGFPEFQTRYAGLVGVKQAYGVKKVKFGSKLRVPNRFQSRPQGFERSRKPTSPWYRSSEK